jgi:signal transduction histidine kinase
MSESGSVRGWWVRRSLRLRLTAAATLAIVVALSAAGAVLVVVVHRTMVRSVDSTALERARAVGATVSGGGASAIVAVERHSDAVVQVVQSDGTVVIRSANARQAPRLFHFTPVGDEAVRSVTTRLPIDDAADSYRVAVVRATGGVLVYAAVANDDAQETTRVMVATLAGGVPALACLLAFVTWFLVGRALRPVEALREQAARITTTDLQERLTPPAAQDELHRLALTLNDLLERLESSTRRQREFVADAAHELRSPLTVMRAQLEVAAAHPDRYGASQLPDLLSEVERVSGLVDNLLHLARLDSRRAVNARVIDLDDVVFTEVTRVRATTDVTVDVSNVSAAQVDGDLALLTHMVRNLLDNAVRYATSRVEVALRLVDGRIELTVTDDGPGIAPGDRKNVFERFTRIDGARSRDSADNAGFGLGLAIVHDVVTVHGGSVVVADHGPGARLVVQLPARRIAAAKAAVSRQESTAAEC